MKYQDAPRPPLSTGWALHDSNQAGSSPSDVRQHARNLRNLGITFYKLLADGENKAQRAKIYLEHGIMPIVRLYAPRPHPRYIPDPNHVKQYVDVGVKYFEIGNEGNLLEEWEEGAWYEVKRDHSDPKKKSHGAWMAHQWVQASAVVKGQGGIPLVYAATPGGHVNHRIWTIDFLNELSRLGRLDTMQGAGVGIHPRPLNNPPDAPRDTGNPPNTTTWNEHLWYIETYTRYLGYTPAFFCTEHGYSPTDSQNSNYPPIDQNLWAEYNAELFLRMNPAHPKTIHPAILCLCYWLEINEGAGGVWINDGMFGDGRAWADSAPRPDDRAWGKKLFQIAPAATWHRKGSDTPTNPPTNPVPPTTPPTTPPREVINQPAWVSFVEPTVAVNAEYFELTRFRFVDEAEAQGKVNIFILDPHNPNLRIRVTNTGTGTVAEIPLDKPAGEPAANVPMFGIGNVYDVEMLGLPSVKVRGMQLPGNRHVFYELTFAKRVKQGTPPPPPNTLETALWTACEAVQIPVNRTFALPKALIATSQSLGDNGLGVEIVTGEVRVTYEGFRYVAQMAQRFSDNLKVIAYCKDGDWNNVRVIRK